MSKTKIEYFDDTHTYCVDGVIVPSVSTLVAFATGNIYTNIPDDVLKKAGEYGTSVHEAIENYESSGLSTEGYEEQLEKYLALKKEYILEVSKMEQIVNYGKHYCGRYDIMDIDDTLWDIKTTSKLHEENLAWQLGLYYLGLGKEKDIGYAIWIPKRGKAKVKLIKPHTNKECIELFEMYEKSLTK